MAYIKVYTTKSGLSALASHHLIHSFTPGDTTESTAYLRAADVMRKHPGSRWAVSEPCYHACTALPIVGEHRSADALRERARPRATDRDVLKAIHAGDEVDPTTIPFLAASGFALEVFPGQCALTEAGKWGIGLLSREEVTDAAA